MATCAVACCFLSVSYLSLITWKRELFTSPQWALTHLYDPPRLESVMSELGCILFQKVVINI